MADGRFIWRDGTLVPWDEATVHVLSHALHYGSGVFEGIRAYRTEAGTAVLRLTDHMRRLHRSAAACMIPLEWSVEQLAAAAKQVVVSNELDSGYIRPIAFYDSGGLGVLPRNVRVTTMIAVWQWGAYLAGANNAGFYQVIVRNSANSVTSSVVTLTVTSDVSGPEPVTAEFDANGFIQMYFNENVIRDTTTNVNNYVINMVGYEQARH
mgnify:CR=1 FL=1